MGQQPQLAPALYLLAPAVGPNHSVLLVGASRTGAVSTWELERDCQQTGDWEMGGAGPRPTPEHTAASQPTVPFEMHKFMHWAPSPLIKFQNFIYY